MSLYLKYRPDSLAQVVGNEEMVSSLATMLATPEKLPHAILLTGPTGCGKTTIGRIIAKELGCVGADFTEVDSADFRGIDSIREIRKSSMYKPLEGACRVWLIDEMHRLTNDAQSALLKILEDTPSHIYFILCTTDPQKLLPTLKGRCSTFTVKVLEDAQMMKLLRRVVKAEECTMEKAVYEQIIKSAEGHSRNALQILDQVLYLDPEEQLAMAQKAEENKTQSIELCRALLGGKSWKTVASILEGLKEEQPESIRRMVLGYCTSVLLKTDNRQAAMVMEAFMEPFYDTLFPGLVFACYSAVKGGQE